MTNTILSTVLASGSLLCQVRNTPFSTEDQRADTPYVDFPVSTVENAPSKTTVYIEHVYLLEFPGTSFESYLAGLVACPEVRRPVSAPLFAFHNRVTGAPREIRPDPISSRPNIPNRQTRFPDHQPKLGW
ncbi:hypothetical protein F5B22DRAFT_647790 [Xylaria bambusicola]|uniref:uncharacterized protein n=1 Tax=Xylaria bambusicola TaxID=326684 RepID=UPI002007F888|nr:uncharacterized protein F5B22DRAFT_647790 [Xylaria bambusicola]KAI0513244.1 hypothetical protein F5B22DRAFT_647790 [Xylaria bambusicola]